MPDDLARALAAEPSAQANFELLSSQNRYAVLYRIHSAKRADTRARRIEEFVVMLARGETVHPQKRALASDEPPFRSERRVQRPRLESSAATQTMI